jgi:hypothetical protein
MMVIIVSITITITIIIIIIITITIFVIIIIIIMLIVTISIIIIIDDPGIPRLYPGSRPGARILEPCLDKIAEPARDRAVRGRPGRCADG